MSDPKTEDGTPIACVSCRFWDSYKKNGEGACRKNPPTFLVLDNPQQDPRGGMWPVTDGGAWCGAWEPPATPTEGSE